MGATDILKSFSKVQVSIVAVVAAMSAVGGAALGAKLAIDKYAAELQQKADEALQREIIATRNYLKVQNKTEEFATPEQALETLHPEKVEALKSAAAALVSYGGHDLRPRPGTVEVVNNVFTDAAIVPEGFDYEEELKRRDPDKPYLITKDEFFENGPNYDQLSFTYYEKDGVLLNQEDEIVDDFRGVGAENLMRFGHGSEDPNVVYVRNVNANLDFEISLSKDSYAESLGFTPDDDDLTELQHSDRRPLRKFRDSDQ